MVLKGAGAQLKEEAFISIFDLIVFGHCGEANRQTPLKPMAFKPDCCQLSTDIENWVVSYQHLGQAVAGQQKEYLQMFYLVLQVCYYLMVGQVKSGKAVLKQLQQSIQTITAPDWPVDADLSKSREADQFIWMPREHLCVLVYLVTVMHSMQAGFMEKAERYTDKAIVQNPTRDVQAALCTSSSPTNWLCQERSLSGWSHVSSLMCHQH